MEAPVQPGIRNGERPVARASSPCGNPRRPGAASGPHGQDGHATRGRRAFTLIELVLVLAIIIVMIGLSWPILEKPLAYERLRHAAELVMAEWTTARVEAMRSGDHTTFTYEAGSATYKLSFRDGEEPTELPEGVTFVSSQKEDDAREVFEAGGTGDLGNPEIWFYADGTCSDVPELLLRNEYGMQIRITLRGLTGVAFLDENVEDSEEEATPTGAKR
jgi:type II secretory pathway pseudopilin PulG